MPASTVAARRRLHAPVAGLAARPQPAGAELLARLEAERLVARLAELCKAPAKIAWEPGLRAVGLAGRTSAAAPERLEVDPALPREHVLETAAHEFVHSLELRGHLTLRHRAVGQGERCTALATPIGQAIADRIPNEAARISRSELETILWMIAGELPRALLATGRIAGGWP